MGGLLLAPVLIGQPLVISELMYQPPGGSPFAEAEFIELHNPGTLSIPLGGAFFSGVGFTFPAGAVLAPGARAVLVRNRTLFQSRYGVVPGLVAGNFTGALNNSGETVSLTSAGGVVLAEVRFGTDGGWPTRPAGQGGSLELVDFLGPQNNSTNWRASSEYFGTPGNAGSGPLNRIVVNELLAHTDPPLEDAVEFFNRTGSPIDISGWYLSNSTSDPTRFRVPSGTVVPARGFRVVYEYQFNPVFPAAGQTAFTFGAARGDTVTLLSVDASGNPLRWEDVQTFPASPNGYSFGRYPDGEGPFFLLNRLSLGTGIVNVDPPEFLPFFRQGQGAANGPHSIGPVVFGRIRYSASSDGIEFVELVNATDIEMPLFDPLYPTNTWAIEGGISFQFPEPETLPPNGRIVVSGSTNFAALRTLLSLPGTVPIVGPYTGQLASEGETLRLVRPDPPQLPPRPDAGFVPYYVVEQVDYAPTAPWPVLDVPASQLIRRRSLTRAGYDPSNWEAAPVQSETPVALLQVVGLEGGNLRLRLTGAPGGQFTLETVALTGDRTVTRIATVASGSLVAPPGTVDSQGRITRTVDVPFAGVTGLIRLRVE